MGGVPEKDRLRQMWNGGDEPPSTATPEVSEASGGVRIACATPGASIGYWIERRWAAQRRATHVVQSWGYERLIGEAGMGERSAKIGDECPAPPSWEVYSGEVIPLKKGETPHVNAMRIGYKPALIDYVDGKVTAAKAHTPRAVPGVTMRLAASLARKRKHT
jgi:N-sulfoglucosamine sulfohydrolase